MGSTLSLLTKDIHGLFLGRQDPLFSFYTCSWRNMNAGSLQGPSFPRLPSFTAVLFTSACLYHSSFSPASKYYPRRQPFPTTVYRYCNRHQRLWVQSVEPDFCPPPLLFQMFQELHKGQTRFLLRLADSCQGCINVRRLKVTSPQS